MTVTNQTTSKKVNWWRLFTRLQNPLMKRLLRSPVHFLVSRYYMLITVTGRKSGKIYTTPVQYKQVGNDIFVITNRDYQWWKNLRGGVEVTVHIRGVDVVGEADISLNPAEIRQAFDTIYPSMKPEQKDKYVDDTVVVVIRCDPKSLK